MSIVRDGDMTTPARLAAAIGGLVLAPLMLTGCASEAAFDEAIPPAVLAADSNIVDTHLRYSNGLAGRGIGLRIYVADTSDAAVAHSIDAALDAAFHASPLRPTDILLDVAEAPRPDGEININLGKLRLDDVTPLLDLPGTVIDDQITLGADELESVYGPWEK